MPSLPPLPEAFYWTEQSWGAALRCRPLDAVAPHLFTTRHLALPADAAVARLTAALGVGTVVFPTQVHGASVAVFREDAPVPPGRFEADALVSNRRDAAVAVRAADCVPLLMADRVTGVVAAVHAGWRGTAARVAVAALHALGDTFGTRPADVIAAIGPSILPCCYEVGSEVVDAFAAAGHERYLIQRWFATPPPPRGSFPPSRTGDARPVLRLDLAGANRDQLVLAGVPDEQVHSSDLCTAMHLDVLTSYRVEKDKAGRIAGVIRKV